MHVFVEVTLRLHTAAPELLRTTCRCETLMGVANRGPTAFESVHRGVLIVSMCQVSIDAGFFSKFTIRTGGRTCSPTRRGDTHLVTISDF